MLRALAFRATIVADSPLLPRSKGKVFRTVAIREDQTLEQLHEALRLAFGWADPHLYCFWRSGRFWDRESVRYSAPFELPEDELSARVEVRELGLRKGAELAYLFDYGDEWRLQLRWSTAGRPASTATRCSSTRTGRRRRNTWSPRKTGSRAVPDVRRPAAPPVPNGHFRSRT